MPYYSYHYQEMSDVNAAIEEAKLIFISVNAPTNAYRVGKGMANLSISFKALNRILQVKTFVGTSENAVRSQIDIAKITFLLVEFIRKTIAKKYLYFEISSKNTNEFLVLFIS
ncbi:MAG: hypothetical protein ACOCVN_02185 [bacterium]